jgi:hypothetical protein
VADVADFSDTVSDQVGGGWRIFSGYRLTRAHKASYGTPATSATFRHPRQKTIMKYLISTKVVERSCTCGAALLTAYAEGLPARVDRMPLDAPAEIAALLEGRWTFALAHGELVHRDALRIRGGYVGDSIHAQHRCAPTYRQPTLGAT